MNFSYNTHEIARTAGQQNAQSFKSVQSWKTPNAAKPQESATASSQQKILDTLEKAATGHIGAFDAQLETALTYADAGRPIRDMTTPAATQESFQFSDVVDAVNPLHHLPVVGMVYRGLSGDTLHPMSHIIGGALYGGPIGAITGTMNAITQVQTGMDMGDHALGFMGLRQENSLSNTAIAQEQNSTIQTNSLEGLEGTTLAFANLSAPREAIPKQNMPSNKDNLYNQELKLLNLKPQEEITNLAFSAMPPKVMF